jgi:carotenoid cleavage dioxygenase-like enzyme
VTEHFAVFLDSPAVFDFAAGLQGGSPITWEPDNGCRIGLLPRDGSGDAVWFETDPCAVFHFLNAYEDGDRVVIDLCRAERLQLGFVDDRPGDAPPAIPHRYVIDRTTGTVTCAQTLELPADFPRIDDRRAGSRHTHGWYAAISGDGPFGEFDSVVHHDVTTDERSVHRLPDGWVTGEATFAADPDGDEGDGWVCSFVIDRPNDVSYLQILTARDVAAGPVAMVRLPQRVPFGFHGSWFEGTPAPT